VKSLGGPTVMGTMGGRQGWDYGGRSGWGLEGGGDRDGDYIGDRGGGKGVGAIGRGIRDSVIQTNRSAFANQCIPTKLPEHIYTSQIWLGNTIIYIYIHMCTFN
jgi:hypothetical protein